MIFLPSWFPLNVYDFACWARQTVVALAVVLPYRPQRPLPFGLEELHGAEPWSPPDGGSLTGRGLVALDRLLHLYGRRPVRALREAALARAERWIARAPGGRRRAGAGSSRRGCTRCSLCTCAAIRSITP